MIRERREVQKGDQIDDHAGQKVIELVWELTKMQKHKGTQQPTNGPRQQQAKAMKFGIR